MPFGLGNKPSFSAKMLWNVGDIPWCWSCRSLWSCCLCGAGVQRAWPPPRTPGTGSCAQRPSSWLHRGCDEFWRGAGDSVVLPWGEELIITLGMGKLHNLSFLLHPIKKFPLTKPLPLTSPLHLYGFCSPIGRQCYKLFELSHFFSPQEAKVTCNLNLGKIAILINIFIK